MSIDKLKVYFADSGKEDQADSVLGKVVPIKAVEPVNPTSTADLMVKNMISAFTGQHPEDVTVMKDADVQGAEIEQQSKIIDNGW